MAARRPNQGPVARTPLRVQPPSDSAYADILTKKPAALRDGRWRPNRRFARQTGLLVTLRHARGITARDRLRSPFRFPVPILDSFDMPYRHPWAQHDTISAGPQMRDQEGELPEWTFSTMLLDDVARRESDRRLVVWPHVPFPQLYLRELRLIAGELGNARATPFRIVVSQPVMWDEPLVNSIAVLTGIVATVPANEEGVFRLSLTVQKLPESEIDRRRQPRRDEQKRVFSMVQNEAREDAGTEGPDTLYELAKRFYGEPSMWRRIAKANGIKNVSPRSSEALEDWCAAHHKKKLVIPPRGRR